MPKDPVVDKRFPEPVAGLHRGVVANHRISLLLEHGPESIVHARSRMEPCKKFVVVIHKI